ncbi:hypothetical protein emb_1d0179 [Coriobacteriaceae bacterium EMTCatB1]|nr:hypothetical protein emb_1d0179 [Coriobacteriaceae bacterium EMTCatB1]
MSTLSGPPGRKRSAMRHARCRQRLRVVARPGRIHASRRVRGAASWDRPCSIARLPQDAQSARALAA